jgi:acetylornithine deacetylase/succinyl-diaminopimelate desuccinylase family protein
MVASTHDSSAEYPGTTAGITDARESRVLEAVDDAETLVLLRELIEHRSDNPPGNEAECAEFLASFLEQRGIEANLVEAAPNRPNLYASIGTSSPKLVFCGHLDTVPAGDGWTFGPFSGTVADGRVYGRGACDMKAGLAAMVAAMLAVRRSGVPISGSVALHAVIDEEFACAGGRKAASEQPGDWAIVAEPSSSQVFATGNGQACFAITFHGKAVHSSHPEQGRNAINDAAAFIGRLEEETLRLAESPFPGIGPGTYSIGLVEGGRGGSTVPDRCEVTIDRRVLPCESLDSIDEELQRLLERLAAERPGLKWELSRPVAFPPLAGTDSGHLEQVLTSAVRDLGRPIPEERQGMRFATDAAWYEAAGCPAVVFGPGDVPIAHQPDEYVAIEDLNAAARALALCCVRLLT